MANPVPLRLSPFTRFSLKSRSEAVLLAPEQTYFRRVIRANNRQRGPRIVDRGSRIGDDCAQLSAAKECVADAFSSSDFASRWETTHFSSQDWNFISLPRSWRGSTTHLWLPLQRLWVSNENACRAASVRGRCAFRWYRNRWSTESNVTDYYWYSRDWSWHMRYGFFENDEWILSLN